MAVRNALAAGQWLLHDAEHIDAAPVSDREKAAICWIILAVHDPHVRRIAVQARGQHSTRAHRTVALPLRAELLLACGG